MGVVVRRDVALDYYVGTRYIAELGSNIFTVAVDYAINPKYTLSVAESTDTGLGKYVQTDFALTRRFDNCFLVLRAYNNQTTGQSGFGVNFVPGGVSGGLDTATIGNGTGGVR